MKSSVPSDSISKKRERLSLVPALIGVGIFAVGALLSVFLGLHSWLALLRWVGLAVIAAAAWRRGSLTYWIFFAMLLGGEIGLDRPQLGEHLRILSDIFLRLITVIVAPLILGSLITGIAGHGDLRSVGRMGVKSLVYFEIVTTIALVIGLAAINFSRAGVGVAMTGPALSAPSAPPLRWDDFQIGRASCRERVLLSV